ncbi:MAG: oligosaccharide flippase family protein [Marinifilaceae bacterium]|nr:oligosaccharide flippase family protein [Marinifilaceae bacterium]
MSIIKKLAGETVIYGLSSIVGRFLNWLLVPLYTNILLPAEYGVVTKLMAYVAVCMVLLTYGLETAYFRFASKPENKEEKVFSNCISSILFSSISFGLLVYLCSTWLVAFLDISAHPSYLFLLLGTVLMDVVMAIPFARLRMQSKAMRYAILKLVNIFTNIGLNLFFFLLYPWLRTNISFDLFDNILGADFGLGYIFLSYFIASLVNLVLLIPSFSGFRFGLDYSFYKQILKYAFPILIVSLCGMLNLQIDKILLPELLNATDVNYQLGIYGANIKLAVIMTMFIQAFRYAFEPFFFKMQAKGSDYKKNLAEVMHYFLIFSLLIFLGVEFYIDIIKYFIGEKYHEGINVLPIVLGAQFFYGIFFSLSVWYKVTDKTKYGAYFAILGSVVVLLLNIILVPRIGYMGSAWAMLVCFLTMTVVSYIYGRRHYPIPYNMKKIAFYFTFALILYIVSINIEITNMIFKLGLKTVLLIIFISIAYLIEIKGMKSIFKSK